MQDSFVEEIWLGNGKFRPGAIVYTRDAARDVITHEHRIIERLEVSDNGDQRFLVETSLRNKD